MNGTAVRKVLLVVLLLAASLWAFSALGVDIRQLSPGRVRTTVLSYGTWAPLAYFVAFGQPIVPLPASAMIALAGLVFGTTWGPVAGLAGATLRASASFLIARWLGREAVSRLLHGRVARLDQKLGEHAFKAVFFIRLIPNVPFDMQNYGLGFSRVRFGPYVLATVLGLIPASLAYAYLGDSLTDPTQFWKVLVAVGSILALVAAQWAWGKRVRVVTREDGQR